MSEQGFTWCPIGTNCWKMGSTTTKRQATRGLGGDGARRQRSLPVKQLGFFSTYTHTHAGLYRICYTLQLQCVRVSRKYIYRKSKRDKYLTRNDSRRVMPTKEKRSNSTISFVHANAMWHFKWMNGWCCLPQKSVCSLEMRLTLVFF